MAENQLKTLEKKIDELIALCSDLNRENQSLKHESMSWQDERLRLVENNELARVKVEAMINRLQALEQEERFRRSFEDSTIGMTIVETSGQIRLANQAFCDMLGYNRDDPLGFRAAGYADACNLLGVEA